MDYRKSHRGDHTIININGVAVERVKTIEHGPLLSLYTDEKSGEVVI